jgi:hypothetical protein
MGLLKFSEFKSQRKDVREAKDKELSNKKFNEKIKSKLEELGVSSMSELSEDQVSALLDSLKPTPETTSQEVEPIEDEEQVKDDKKTDEGVFPNLAKRSGASTAVAKATGMPKGKGIDAKESLNVMPVKEMCGKVHEMAVMHDSDDEESHTYEGYLKECADMINAMKKVGISESNLNEAKVDNEEEFKKYGQSVLKKAFGDKYDEDKANDVIDGISKKVDGDWGAAIGILQSSLG